MKLKKTLFMNKFNLMKKKNRKNDDGFTLIEAMVVMIVGVMVLAGAAAGINKLFVANNVSTESQNIQSIAANMKTVASSEGGYSAIKDNKTAISLHVFPTNMKIDDTSNEVKNVWGGKVTIAGSDDSYDLVYPSVPAEECIQIASKLRNAAWDTLKVKNDQGNETEIKSTTSLEDIQTACGNSGKSTFTFTGH